MRTDSTLTNYVFKFESENLFANRKNIYDDLTFSIRFTFIESYSKVAKSQKSYFEIMWRSFGLIAVLSWTREFFFKPVTLIRTTIERLFQMEDMNCFQENFLRSCKNGMFDFLYEVIFWCIVKVTNHIFCIKQKSKCSTNYLLIDFSFQLIIQFNYFNWF